MTAQVQVLNKILQTKDYSIIEKNNLSADYFYSYKAEYEFIKNHIKQYNVVPDQFTFISIFKDFPIVEVAEPDNFLLEQLQKEYSVAVIAAGFNKAKEAIEKDKADKAIEIIKNTTDNLKVKTTMSCTSFKQDLSRYDRYIDRVTNKNTYYISTGFKELDDIIGGIDVENENMVIAARTGVGKCLEKGTKVLMADGTLKNVEDVQIGDKVQSYGRVNIVIGTHNGVSNGYKIIPSKGNPFVVSSQHILTVMELQEHYDKNALSCKNSKRKGAMVTNNNYVLKDIMIEDYMKLSKHKKHLLKLFRPEIEYSTKEQLIDPYIFGVWLGDGTSNAGQITTMDNEIVQSLYDFAAKNNLEVHKLDSQTKENSKAVVYSIINPNDFNKGLKSMLRHIGVLGNKHIPLNYLTGDADQRLQLLAGLLDTDGHYSHYTKNNKTTSMFDFCQKNKILFDQVCQLARSLGFKVCCSKPKHLFDTDYYRCSISGNLFTIPTRIARKKAFKSNSIQDPRKVSFKVEPVERVEYYGFMCDGDHRFLLADNTLTHNTYCLLKMAVAGAKAGKTVGIYSGEMTADKVFYRLDTLLGNINNKVITRGIDLSVQRQYKQYLDNINSYCSGDIKVITPNDINGPATVDALQAFVERENLDMLLVDQYSLLEDTSRAKASFERVANISKAIKNLQVLKRIPIISVSQLNRQEKEDGEQDTTQIGLSDRIGQDATTIIMLARKITYSNPEKTKVKDDKLVINVVKSRDGGNGKLEYLADFNTGRFIYLDPNEQVDASYYESPAEDLSQIVKNDAMDTVF